MTLAYLTAALPCTAGVPSAVTIPELRAPASARVMCLQCYLCEGDEWLVSDSA